jgi:hypothetical protein
LILSPARYWLRSTNHLAPLYAISSIPSEDFLNTKQFLYSEGRLSLGGITHN